MKNVLEYLENTAKKLRRENGCYRGRKSLQLFRTT